MSADNRLSEHEKQKRQYSGKRKRYHPECAGIADRRTAQIISNALGNGSKHDFQVFFSSVQ
jgi:hypothetical protein